MALNLITCLLDKTAYLYIDARNNFKKYCGNDNNIIGEEASQLYSKKVLEK